MQSNDRRRREFGRRQHLQQPVHRVVRPVPRKLPPPGRGGRR